MLILVVVFFGLLSMKIKNIIYTLFLFFFITQIIAAQDFISPDSSCTVNINYLKHHCYDCSEPDSSEKCKVEEFRYLGEVNNHFYYSAITLEFDTASGMDLDKEYNERDVTIYEGKNKEKVSPVYYTGGGLDAFEHVYTELISTKSGSFIHIYVSDGNGGWDFGEYFLFKKSSWHKLEIPDFIDSLNSIIPETGSFCRGNVIDLKKMIYEIPVFKKDDPCCCPTGGMARAYLTVKKNKFIIIKKEYYPDLK